MFLTLSKALPILLSPLIISLALFGAAIALAKRPKAVRMFCAAGVLLLLVFSSPIVAGALLHSLEDQYPDQPLTAVPTAQAIVVLGGAMHVPGPIHNRSALLTPSDRILHAFRLYRAGKAPLIVISGGNIKGGTPESLYMSQLLAEWGVPREAILMEGRSRTTRENATCSRELLQARGISKILLVTSATHMLRAAALFRKVGFVVVPAPADFVTGWGHVSILETLLPSAGAMQASGTALREWGGLAVSRLRGWV